MPKKMRHGKPNRDPYGNSHRLRNADPYDRKRDDELDFPDDPRQEPDLDEVKERAYRCVVDESAGERERRYGDG